VRGAASDEMGRGKLYHELLASLITRAKKLIYMHGVGCVPLLDALKLTPESEPFVVAEVDAVTRQNLAALVAFETERIAQRVSEVLARQPHIGADGLVALALPVTVELSLDGRHLGLSPHVSVDAVSFPNLAVFDVKFGQREDFHRLSTTGYAL